MYVCEYIYVLNENSYFQFTCAFESIKRLNSKIMVI